MMDDEPSQLVIDEDPQPQHSPSSSESVDSKDDPSLTCKFCGMIFEQRTPFCSLHLNDLHSDRPLYRCPQCPLVFAVKRDLSTHFRVHSGESPHQCTQCGKQFGTRQLLKKHTMWHTGERTHVCPHCDKAFYQKGHLTQHLMIHAGRRQHVCNLCRKTFIFKFDLNRHMKLHTERGHSSEKRNRSFLKQTSLDNQLIKCKGLLQRNFALTPSTSTNLSHQSLQMPLPLTPSSSLLANPLYSCMFCGQPNDSKDDLAVHLAVSHFPNARLPQQMTSPVKQESVDSPLFLGLPTPTKLSDGLVPSKNEEIPTICTAVVALTAAAAASSPSDAESLRPVGFRRRTFCLPLPHSRLHPASTRYPSVVPLPSLRSIVHHILAFVSQSSPIYSYCVIIRLPYHTRHFSYHTMYLKRPFPIVDTSLHTNLLCYSIIRALFKFHQSAMLKYCIYLCCRIE